MFWYIVVIDVLHELILLLFLDGNIGPYKA